MCPYTLLITVLLSFLSLMLGISGTEECLSKAEQQLFWKASNYTPSPFLRSVLKKYEKFHRKCRKEESKLDEDGLIAAFKGGNETSNLNCKYIIYFPPYDGLGNKIVSLVSAYLFAILSKRVFLVDKRLDMTKLLCNPFSNSSWTVPELIDTGNLQRMSLPFNNWASSEDTPHSVLVNVNHEQDMKFFCPSELLRLRKVRLLLMESNMYFVPGLYYTKYKKRMESLFPDRLIFTPLGRSILYPNNQIWERVTEFFHRNLKPSEHRLGLQLRTRDAPWRAEKSQRLNRCIKKHGVLPSQQAFVRSESVNESHGRQPVQIAAFVATLKSEFVANLVENYAKWPLKNGKVVKFYRATMQSVQDSSNSAQNEDAMVDMWLLSFTDRLLVSHTSTFGYIASALQGLPPIMINHAHMTLEKDLDQSMADCDLAITPEPCYHNPPYKVQCPRDAAFEDPWNMEVAVRQCLDWVRGVQVVPS